MQIRNQGNPGIRREHTFASDIVPVSGTTFISDSIPVNYATSGILTFFWADFDDTDAIVHVEGSYNGTLWNVLDGNGCVCNSSTDTQLWEFLYLNVLHLRLSITFNGVTAGAFGWEFRGEFNSAKNY